MKTNTKIILINLTAFTALSVFAFVIAGSIIYAPAEGESLASTVISHLVKKSTPSSSPVYHMHLSIPLVGINASVQEVGITKKGNVGTPDNFTDVAWYKDSPVPGAKGTSIIDGHVDNGLALPAVFWNLKNVKKGDDIYIHTKDGRTIHFIVTNIKTYDFNAPTDTIFTQSNNATLKLITCAGVYVAAYRTHNKRLVVTAVRSF